VLRAYSRLRFLLAERGLSQAELHRQVAGPADGVNIKTLHRLGNPDVPLRRVDLRVLAAICRALGVGLGDLIVLADSGQAIVERLPEAKQRRLDELMARHNDGALDQHELAELQSLVDEAEKMTLANARRLLEHRRQLRPAPDGNRRASVG
jgi:DNA-binding Xre family transcriptional regulator